jgi:hypothetical protein
MVQKCHVSVSEESTLEAGSLSMILSAHFSVPIELEPVLKCHVSVFGQHIELSGL